MSKSTIPSQKPNGNGALENLENLPEAFERRAPFRASWEKLIVWTLLDTGLRVAELAHLKKDNIDWQDHRLMIYGKGGPYGSSRSAA
jgi:integrase